MCSLCQGAIYILHHLCVPVPTPCLHCRHWKHCSAYCSAWFDVYLGITIVVPWDSITALLCHFTSKIWSSAYAQLPSLQQGYPRKMMRVYLVLRWVGCYFCRPKSVHTQAWTGSLANITLLHCITNDDITLQIHKILWYCIQQVRLHEGDLDVGLGWCVTKRDITLLYYISNPHDIVILCSTSTAHNWWCS